MAKKKPSFGPPLTQRYLEEVRARAAYQEQQATKRVAKKYHVSDDGQYRPCRAEKGRCPYGEEQHFWAETDGEALTRASEIFAPKSNELHVHNTDALKTNPNIQSLDPRTIESQLLANAEADGELAERLEAHLKLELPGQANPIILERKMGPATGTDFRRRAIWSLEGTDGTHRIKIEDLSRYLTNFRSDQTDPLVESVTEDTKPLQELFTRGAHIKLPWSQKSRKEFSQWSGLLHRGEYKELSAELEEANEEARFRLVETIGMLEWEASSGDQDSIYAATDSTRLSDPMVIEQWERPFNGGAINYGSSGWRPEHLRGITLKNPENHFNSGEINLDRLRPVVDGFSVYETDAGAGRANWRMTRDNGAWRIDVQGTRGDTKSFYVSSSAEAEQLVNDYFSRRVAKRNLQMAADRLEFKEDSYPASKGMTPKARMMESDFENTSTKQRNNRVSFMKRTIEEVDRYNSKVEQLRSEVERDSSQATPPSPPPEEKKGAFSKLRSLF